MIQKIHTAFKTRPLAYFFDLHRRKQLNLNPGFQRKSVWSEKDRKKLIYSILDGYPLPSIFVYRRQDSRGREIFDVLDGKQRLEAVFAFARLRGFGQQGFDVEYRFTGVPHADDKKYHWNWYHLKSWRRHRRILDYKVQIVEVKGGLPEIQRLFVLINSTGKKLSKQEQRKANFITSPILAASERLASRLANRLQADLVISNAQRQRMKDVELLCELIISFYQSAPINKKAAVDAAMSGQAVNHHTIKKAVRDIKSAYKLLRRLIPDFRETRFKNVSEFYSLMLVIHQLQNQGMNLHDGKGLRIGERLLRRLSIDASRAQVDRRTLQSGFQIKPVVRDYLMAVEQGADALGQRKKRQEILLDLLKTVFSERDRQRSFSQPQRELVWANSLTRRCPGLPGEKCTRMLDWKNFQVDHIKPWSRGGKSDLQNARVLCGPCNRRKGAKQMGE